MYIQCMKLAGAVIHAHAEFGDWSGTSIALVTYEGKTGFTSWSFGSCSHCDAYWRHFGYETPTNEDSAEFGRGCLRDIMSYEKILLAFPESDWDLDDHIHSWLLTREEQYRTLIGD